MVVNVFASVCSQKRLNSGEMQQARAEQEEMQRLYGTSDWRSDPPHRITLLGREETCIFDHSDSEKKFGIRLSVASESMTLFRFFLAEHTRYVLRE